MGELCLIRNTRSLGEKEVLKDSYWTKFDAVGGGSNMVNGAPLDRMRRERCRLHPGDLC